MGGGSFLAITEMDHFRPNFVDFFLVFLVFASLSSIWFIFRNKQIKEVGDLVYAKYPITSRIAKITYSIIKAWLTVIFLTFILINIISDFYK